MHKKADIPVWSQGLHGSADRFAIGRSAHFANAPITGREDTTFPRLV